MPNNVQLTNTDTPGQDTEAGDACTFMVPAYPEGERFEFDGQGDYRKYKIPDGRQVRIYCDGVYDLFHYGHARQLQQAKHLFPNVYLLVGVHSDETTRRNKGAAVFNENERYEGVKHCRYVDEMVEDAPWLITDDFLEKHRIDYVSHDDLPYQYDGVESGDLYLHLKQANKFVPTLRTKDISTTMLITRILKDSELYIERQLDRGVPEKDLGILKCKCRNVEGPTE